MGRPKQLSGYGKSQRPADPDDSDSSQTYRRGYGGNRIWMAHFFIGDGRTRPTARGKDNDGEIPGGSPRRPVLEISLIQEQGRQAALF